MFSVTDVRVKTTVRRVHLLSWTQGRERLHHWFLASFTRLCGFPIPHVNQTALRMVRML